MIPPLIAASHHRRYWCRARLGRGLKTAPSRRPRGLSSNLSTDEPVRDRRSAARSEAPGCGTSVVQRARGPGPPQTSSPAPHRSTHRSVLNPDAQARSSSPVRRNKNIGACHALLARLAQASSRAGSSNLRAPSPSPGATPGRARSEHLQPRYAPRQVASRRDRPDQSPRLRLFDRREAPERKVVHSRNATTEGRRRSLAGHLGPKAGRVPPVTLDNPKMGWYQWFIGGSLIDRGWSPRRRMGQFERSSPRSITSDSCAWISSRLRLTPPAPELLLPES